MSTKNSDQKYMKLALKEALKAMSLNEVPIGAVVVFDNRVIGKGFNQKEKDKEPTAHAEMIAIREAANYLASWRLNKCVIYVTLEPCPMCAGALLQARIERLVFAAYDRKAGACGSLYNLVQDDRFNHQIIVEQGILATQSRELLQNFFQQLRK